MANQFYFQLIIMSSISSSSLEPTQHDGFSEFATYEDYLDSQILPEDMKYLEVSSISSVQVQFNFIPFSVTIAQFQHIPNSYSSFFSTEITFLFLFCIYLVRWLYKNSSTSSFFLSSSFFFLLFLPFVRSIQLRLSFFLSY